MTYVAYSVSLVLLCDHENVSPVPYKFEKGGPQRERRIIYVGRFGAAAVWAKRRGRGDSQGKRMALHGRSIPPNHLPTSSPPTRSVALARFSFR